MLLRAIQVRTLSAVNLPVVVVVVVVVMMVVCSGGRLNALPGIVSGAALGHGLFPGPGDRLTTYCAYVFMGGGETIEKEKKEDGAWAINTVIRALTFANGSSLSCVGSTGEASRQDNERKTCDQQKDTRSKEQQEWRKSRRDI